jgi:hypothetical protein
MKQINPTKKNKARKRNFERILPKNHSLQDKRRQGSEEGLAKVIIPPVLNTAVEQKKGQTAPQRFAPKIKYVLVTSSDLHGCI